MRGFVINADAEDRNAFCQILFVVVAKIARFFGAAGSVIFWVEVQNDALSGEVSELDRVAIRIFDGEVGGDCAGGKCHTKNPY